MRNLKSQKPSCSTTEQAETLPQCIGTVPDEVVNWADKGSVAIFDQGLISGSNFILSILLARWLTPERYGAYAISFGLFVLLTLIYGALVLEPMAVFGGAGYRHCLRGYFGSLLWLHLAITAPMCILIGLAAVLLHARETESGLPGALLGVALASPSVLLFWLARRAFYLKMSPSRAAAGALLYSTLMLSGLYLLYRYSLLSPFTAFLLIAIAALLATAMLLSHLSLALQADGPGPGFHQTWQRHWKYGRWALASCFAAWIPAYIFFPLLTKFSSTAQTGELKALTNFISPLDQALAALSLLFLPYAARVQARQDRHRLALLTRNLLAVSVVGAIVYWLVIIQFRQPLFQMLYSGKYSKIAYLLPVVALGSLFWTAAYGPAIALRAMESPASVFLAYLATTLVCLVVGVPATRAFGLKGAVWTGTAADVGSFIVIISQLRRKLNPSVRTVYSAELCSLYTSHPRR